jgi:hypothetical protein
MPSSLNRSPRLLPATVTLLFLAAGLTGCGLGTPAGPAGPPSLSGAHIKGRVIGGQQPVKLSNIQLYTVGGLTYGSASTPLLAVPAVTGDDGNFTIATPYTCPSGKYVYAVATQGDSGYTNNPSLALMTAVGLCDNLSASTAIEINEVTTVASVYALAPFMAGLASVGSPSSNTYGLANAFADVNVLADTTMGTSPGPAAPTGAVIPSATMYTIANALAACVNSAGGAYNDGSSCGTLFFAANPGGTSGSAPTDTLTAAMNIAQHPALNVSAIYGLGAPQSPFPNALATQPNDFTLAVTFKGGGIASPSALAADAGGNIWIANQGSAKVSELSSTGVPVSGSPFAASLVLATAIAIDPAGNVWVANTGTSTVSELTSAGGVVSGSPFSGGGLDLPSSLAIDSLSNVWVSNAGNTSVTRIAAGTLTNYPLTGIASPVAIAVNPH